MAQQAFSFGLLGRWRIPGNIESWHAQLSEEIVVEGIRSGAGQGAMLTGQAAKPAPTWNRMSKLRGLSGIS